MTDDDSKRLAEGTQVKVTGPSVSGDAGMDSSAAQPGREYKVYDYVPAGHEDNDDPLGKDYVMLDPRGSYGGSRWAYPEHVEVVRTVEQLAARQIPSLKEVSQAVSGGMHSLMGEGMEFFETSIEGEDDAPYIYGSGRTDEGLGFGVKVAVLEVYLEDDEF